MVQLQSPRAMDDLDRLAFRMMRIIRQRFPHLREQGFSLGDVEQTLLPFRDARREMADGSAESWEITVLRLLSGERGYLDAEQELRDACNDSLSMPSPTIARVRSLPAALTLGPAALALGDTPQPLQAAGRPTTSPGAAGWVAATHSTGRAALENASTTAAPAAAAAPPAAPTTAPTAATMAPATASTTRGEVLSGALPAGIAPTAAGTPKKCCRYCGGRLPPGRTCAFCPHCGLDLNRRQCAACSTSLEIGWRFCVTCGRSAAPPD